MSEINGRFAVEFCRLCVHKNCWACLVLVHLRPVKDKVVPVLN
jgi:hypothetical protein